VTGGAFTFSGSNLDLDPTGSFDLSMDASQTVTIRLATNLAAAFVIEDQALSRDYIEIDTTTGTEDLSFGNTNTNPTYQFLGTGQATFSGNVDAANGLDVTTAALTTAAGFTVSGGAIDLDPSGAYTLNMADGFSATITVDDNQADAFLIQEGTNAYLDITTTDASETMEFGNTTTNPTFTFLGSGEVTIDGDALTLTEQAGDPGATANAGKLYTKDDSGTTELYYQDSGGSVTQLTPSQGGGNATVTATASALINDGAPVSYHNDTGNPRIREADADGASPLPNAVGIAPSQISATASGTVVTSGEVDVADDRWTGGVPAVTDVGEPVYLSDTVGTMTLTAPGGGATVVRMGYVSVGGSGAVKVLVNVGEPVKTQ
jgi:hypothetical protein